MMIILIFPIIIMMVIELHLLVEPNCKSLTNKVQCSDIMISLKPAEASEVISHYSYSETEFSTLGQI